MHLGILTFLRRTSKAWPATPDVAPVVDAPAQEVARMPKRAKRVAAPVLASPQPFSSPLYPYRLELPPGWQETPTTARPGAPAVDRFRNEAVDLSVGIWSEPCPARALAHVLPRERAAAIQFQGGVVVPFVAYTAGGESGDFYLEGRWLRDGRRWTVHAQLPARQREEGIASLRGLLASLCLDC